MSPEPPLTPVHVDMIRIGTVRTDGPAEVIASIAQHGPPGPLTTSGGYSVQPGVYLHRDSVVDLLEGFAHQIARRSEFPDDPSDYAAGRLREMAQHIRMRSV